MPNKPKDTQANAEQAEAPTPPKPVHPDDVAKAIIDIAAAHGFAIHGDGFTLTKNLGGMVARHSYKGA